MVPGTQVGAYRVLQQIGEGGMGAVWLAEHSMLGRRAALKVLHPSFSSQPEIVTRFFNEARAATAISDPGIVQIFDFGHHVDGSAYIVMELLEGETLAQRVYRGPLAPMDALRIMRQVATSLGAAHARGIVHRDLKPENIFLVRDVEVAGGERAKILDFGIAKLVGNTGVKTQTSAVLGTPMYMSPEQCRGAGVVDQRSDIYACGCVLMALVTGRPPFDAEGVGDLIAMHLREPPPLASSRVPGLSPEIDRLIARCLAKDPAQRYANAGELAAAIGALVGLGSTPGPRPATAPGQVMAAQPTTLSSSAVAGSVVRTGSPKWPWAAGAVVVLGAGIAVAVVASRGGEAGAGSGSATATAPATATATATAPATATGSATATATGSGTATGSATAPAKPDPSAQVADRMKAVLAAFPAWAGKHVGEACPDVAALGIDAADPWGHPMKLTCADQPGDQQIGLVSAGADGAFDTGDDVASWTLPRTVTDAVRGKRWVAAAKPIVKTVAKTPVAVAKPVKSPEKPIEKAADKPAEKPKKPVIKLDENGIPIDR